MFQEIEYLKQLMKDYWVTQTFNESKAQDILTQVNALRLRIAIDASVKKLFWETLLVPSASVAGYTSEVWYSRNDTEYLIRRAIAFLVQGVTVNAVNQGNKQAIITREPVPWQQLFSSVQQATVTARGCVVPFDFPQELYFRENEALGLNLLGQGGETGQIIFHGCNLRDTLEDIKVDQLKAEIESYLPEPYLLPIIFQFTAAANGNVALNAAGANQIFTSKTNHSVILTHISTTSNSYSGVRIIDEGNSYSLCNNVDIQGIAALDTNNTISWYPLPYPYLLRRGNRFRFEAVNGNAITGGVTTANALQFLTFKGYSM